MVKKIRMILSLTLTLGMILTVSSGAFYARDYNDADEITIRSDEHLLAIQVLNDLGIVVGIPGETEGTYDFKPDADLTRAELARILFVLSVGYSDDSRITDSATYKNMSCAFTDIENSWAKGEIKFGYMKGYLSGRDGKIYDPNAKVTCREMAVGLLALIGYDKTELAKNWPVGADTCASIDENSDFYRTGLPVRTNEDGTVHIAGYKLPGETEPDEEARLVGTANITREQACYMIYLAVFRRNGCVDPDTGCILQNFMHTKWNVLLSENSCETTVVSGKNQSLVGEPTGNKNSLGVFKHPKLTDTGWLYYGNNTGFSTEQADWDACLGQTVTCTLLCVTKNGRTVAEYIMNYSFDFKKTEPAPAFKGTPVTVSEVKIPAGTECNYNQQKQTLTVGETEYSFAEIVCYETSSVSEQIDAAYRVASLIVDEGTGKNTEEILLTVGSDGKIYKVMQ